MTDPPPYVPERDEEPIFLRSLDLDDALVAACHDDAIYTDTDFRLAQADGQLEAICDARTQAKILALLDAARAEANLP